MDINITRHLKYLYGSLFTRYLVAWCFPSAGSGDRTSIAVTTVIVTPALSCVRLPNGNRSDDDDWLGSGPLSAVKKQSSVLMVVVPYLLRP